jgi:hypothetical protein
MKLINIINNDCKKSKKSQYQIFFDRFKKFNDFKIVQTTYTTLFESDEHNLKYLLTDERLKKNVFIARNKIKADYLKSNIIIDEIKSNQINFYSILPKSNITKSCYLIDVKNAYPTALLNNDIIGPETFNYLNKLSKLNKLRAIGSLAVKKTVKKFKKDKLVAIENIPMNEIGVVYFYAAYLIGDLMFKCELISKDDFLFSWFDGIYIKSNLERAKEISNFLLSEGYENKIIKLNYFKNENISNNKISVTWCENKLDKTINNKIKVSCNKIPLIKTVCYLKIKKLNLPKSKK